MIAFLACDTGQSCEEVSHGVVQREEKRGEPSYASWLLMHHLTASHTSLGQGKQLPGKSQAMSTGQ